MRRTIKTWQLVLGRTRVKAKNQDLGTGASEKGWKAQSRVSARDHTTAHTFTANTLHGNGGSFPRLTTITFYAIALASHHVPLLLWERPGSMMQAVSWLSSSELFCLQGRTPFYLPRVRNGERGGRVLPGSGKASQASAGKQQVLWVLICCSTCQVLEAIASLCLMVRPALTQSRSKPGGVLLTSRPCSQPTAGPIPEGT